MPLKITFDPGEVHEFLRLDPTQEVKVVENLVATAMDEAEGFLNTDFSVITTNPDGTTTTVATEAPPAVKNWVKNRVVDLYENRGQPEAVQPNVNSLRRFRKIPFKG